MRESRVGFLPGSGMEGRRFTQGNWYMDPCRPRMWDLLSDDELTMYVRGYGYMREGTAEF